MRYAVVLLALVVAVQYGIIAAAVVPRLARLIGVSNRLVGAARWGAIAFFAGCAITHLGIAAQALLADDVHGTGGDGWLFAQHVLPHVAQVVGGALFIGIAAGRLELTLLPKEVAARLREREMHFRSAFDRAPIGIALVSLLQQDRGTVLQVNPALCSIVGYDEAELRDAAALDRLVPRADRSVLAAAVGRLTSGEQDQVDHDQRYVHGDGHEGWVNVQASVMRGDEGLPLYAVAQVRDVSDDRRREDQLRFLAEHDSMTGVFNRRRFEEELDRSVALVRRYGEPAALLLVDLDQFKFVNDTYGHAIGDRLICRLVEVLSSRLRDSDVLGRLGGDEFGVLLPSTTEAGALAVAHSLLQSVRSDAHVAVGERTVRATASIGVELITADLDRNGEQLLAEADIAMYEAKETGRDRVSTTGGTGLGGARMRTRLTWSERIRDALDGDGFVLWEQPILDVASGRLVRSELLVRMKGPDGSVVPPDNFLPVAERFGQIQAIDRWVFSQAVRLMEIRHAAGDLRTLEINLSGASLTDEALMRELTDMLAGAAIDPTRVVVEVTETSAVGNLDVARRLAHRLGQVGCRFSLDDFGSGFGSFVYLKHLPFDGVKVDGEFVKDLPESVSDRLTLEAIVSLAHGMGKEVTAEFVQNAATLELLGRLGVGFAQGFWIAEPGPVTELAS